MAYQVLRAALLPLVLLLTVACDGDDGEPESPASPTEAEVLATATSPASSASPAATPGVPATTTAPASPLRTLTLAPAFGGRAFSRPIEMAPYPGGLFVVADQDGLVGLYRPDGAAAGTLLDLRDRVVRSGNEEGLLSIALDPDFPRNSYLYAYYSAGNPRRSVLSRFQVQNDAAIPGSELVVLEQAQPFANHNGGAVRFGPDGLLYLGFGDGGSGGDPMGNGQNLTTLLGKIIRIDVRSASASQPYAIPRDNPFLNQPGARGEIWAYGLRNPWRMSFDPETKQLWAADVGQSAIEEIDVIERGGNYGWNRIEGDRCYPSGNACNRDGTILPVATYDHGDGCSVTGGVVVRGGEVAALLGRYLYADFCSGRIWAMPADRSAAPRQVAGQDNRRMISSFATDGEGNVYFLVFSGPILRVATTT